MAPFFSQHLPVYAFARTRRYIVVDFNSNSGKHYQYPRGIPRIRIGVLLPKIQLTHHEWFHVNWVVCVWEIEFNFCAQTDPKYIVAISYFVLFHPSQGF